MLSVLASDMTVNALSIGMIVLGVALAVVTIRFWKAAGVDPDVLAPLEVMGDRKFARGDDDTRLRLLNSVRPEGEATLDHFEAPAVLDHEPAQQERPFRDTFDHADDAVDVVPVVIDPLLQGKETTGD